MSRTSSRTSAALGGAAAVFLLTSTGSVAHAQQVSAGQQHTVAVVLDGSAQGWGTGLLINNGKPTEKQWKQVSADWQHTCGVTRTGEGFCWGNDDRYGVITRQVSGMPTGKTWLSVSREEVRGWRRRRERGRGQERGERRGQTASHPTKTRWERSGKGRRAHLRLRSSSPARRIFICNSRSSRRYLQADSIVAA